MPDTPADPTAAPPDADRPRAALPETEEHRPRARDGAGAVVGGRYKLLECVGEGGMGAVWSAHQTAPVRRLVAVKLIKAGIDSRAVLARFEAERQALAVMDHPNIAKILDGGVTDSGSPYFVMELVKGVPITRYCDERKLTPAQRLELFVPVCEAIQHAHQKGVIHRDIKPSNVLVALQDGRPVPKVIDFGVAKATGAALTDLTLNTGVGGVVGTPQYMSPEQASLTGLDIDTRSDVYSLGVLLYELLAGSPPFQRRDLEKAGLLEILRVVREEEPPKPSTKLSSADAVASLSASRGTEPKALAGLLRSELDWVVMKALEKDRGRRYDTPTSFAADVRRYLAGEAVQAHPPSVAYRLRKSLRKHRGPVTAASLVALALVAGVVGTSVGQVRAERARTLAETRREQAEAAEGLAETRLGEAVAMRERAMATLRAATGEDVEKLIGSRAELGPNERAYLGAIIRRWEDFAKASGDTPGGRLVAAEGAYRVGLLRAKLGERGAAVADFERSLAIAKKLAADFPAEPEYRCDIAKSHNSLGNLLATVGKSAEAEVEYRAAIALQEKLATDSPGTPDYRDSLATSRYNLGSLLDDVGDATRAEVEYRAAITVLEGLAADSPATPEHRGHLANCCNGLALLLKSQGKPIEAEARHRVALAIEEKLAGDFPAAVEYREGLSSTRNNLVSLLNSQGKSAEAEVEYRAAIALQGKLATDFPAVIDYRVGLAGHCCNMGTLLRGDGHPAGSLPWYDRAIVALTAVMQVRPDNVMANQFLRNNLTGRASACDDLGRPTDAVADWTRAVELSPASVRAAYQSKRANSRVRAGQYAEAVAEVAELTKLDGTPANVVYDFACVYAVASGKVAEKREEYAGRAVGLLAKAVATGFKESGHVAADADLDPLRGRADFRKLVADLEAKHPRPPELAPPPRPAK